MSCRNHPQIEDGLEHCYRCGYRYCADCVVSFQGQTTCAACKDEAVGMLETGQGAAAVDVDGMLPPWERRAELGMVAGFLNTVKAVLFEPTAFFKKMDKTATSWDCLVVPVVIQFLGAIVATVMQLTVFAGMAAWIASLGNEFEALAPMFVTNAFGVIFGLVASPIVALIMVFLFSGAIHLWLLMTSTARLPFHQTMRGYCYASAPNILAVVPFLGGLVGFFWAIVTTVIMVKETHKTSTGHAVMATLWVPLLFICLGCGGALLLAGLGGFAAGGR